MLVDRATANFDDPCPQMLTVLRDQVACDRRLRGASVKVLLYLLPELWGWHYQSVKQVALARALRMRQQLVGDCLAILVRCGQLERGPNDGSLRTYRISAILLARLR